jgi:hypothetical protein
MPDLAFWLWSCAALGVTNAGLVVVGYIKRNPCYPGLVRAELSTIINGPAEKVADQFLDYGRWPQMYPTIRGVRVVSASGQYVTLSVDHAEGRIMNILMVVSSKEVRLYEEKLRYDASFIHRFEATVGETRYTVVADVMVKRPIHLLAPVLRPYIKWQMRRYILEPMRRAFPGLPVCTGTQR